jgi:hypothetical protein
VTKGEELESHPPSFLLPASWLGRLQLVKMVSGSGVIKKRVLIDARHHMLGRLASIIAKELLNGQRVVRVGAPAWRAF